MVEKTFSYFTTDEEFINYIDNKWDGSFSRFINSVKKREMNIIKNNKRHNYFKDMSRYIVMLGFGCFFILFGLNMGWDQLLSFLIVFLLGVFFITSSLVNLYLEVFKKWKMSS